MTIMMAGDADGDGNDDDSDWWCRVMIIVGMIFYIRQ